MRAAGFPLGDPEYTLTQGIVSKADADGESSWASVDSVIEHGEHPTGQPRVAASTPRSARVVAVNYDRRSIRTGTNQFFAIAADQAEPIVEQLREGVDVHSLGINGQAVIDETDGIAGVWVVRLLWQPGRRAGADRR